jgi:hypothetical protein
MLYQKRELIHKSLAIQLIDQLLDVIDTSKIALKEFFSTSSVADIFFNEIIEQYHYDFTIEKDYFLDENSSSNIKLLTTLVDIYEKTFINIDNSVDVTIYRIPIGKMILDHKNNKNNEYIYNEDYIFSLSNVIYESLPSLIYESLSYYRIHRFYDKKSKMEHNSNNSKKKIFFLEKQSYELSYDVDLFNDIDYNKINLNVSLVTKINHQTLNEEDYGLNDLQELLKERITV